MVRIPFSSPNIGKLESEYVNKALASGWIGGKGDFIDNFEYKFARYIGVKHAITCSSGTASLNLAYHACGMSYQHKVIMPDNTFIATYNMARLFTTQIESVPVDSSSWTLNVSELKDCYVVGVHLYGNPVDMGQVYRHKFIFIEDCAQSIGSKYRNRMCGSWGLASCFSFHSAKMITTGEGGMVCTNEQVIADRVRLLKNQSMVKPYEHTGMGYNFRMTNLQAAMGLAQLERIDELIDAKKKTTKFYNDNLSPKFIRQKENRHTKVVKWANAYKLPDGKFASVFIEKMRDKGIECRPGFMGDNIVVLPCATLLTKEELEYVAREANHFIED
jgi:perosamine synthetase